MERLTEQCWRNLDPWECCGQDHYCQRGFHDNGGCTGGCIVPRLYARLAAYEDTGLEPKEVQKISNVFRDISEEYNCWFDFAVKCFLGKVDTEPNTPLTLEELREISRERPVVVWMVHHDPGGQDYGEWAMFLSEENMFIGDGTCWGAKNYGTAFVAYRRKPEEVAG